MSVSVEYIGPGHWRLQPATETDKAQLRCFGVEFDENETITQGEASDLADAVGTIEMWNRWWSVKLKDMTEGERIELEAKLNERKLSYDGNITRREAHGLIDCGVPSKPQTILARILRVKCSRHESAVSLDFLIDDRIEMIFHRTKWETRQVEKDAEKYWELLGGNSPAITRFPGMTRVKIQDALRQLLRQNIKVDVETVSEMLLRLHPNVLQ